MKAQHLYCVVSPFLRQSLIHVTFQSQLFVGHINRRKRNMGKICCHTTYHLLMLPCFQSDISSVALTRSGLSLEELRIVEGQGQSSEVITPPEEVNRMNDLGV